jgi:hypothetical protein
MHAPGASIRSMRACCFHEIYTYDFCLNIIDPGQYHFHDVDGKLAPSLQSYQCTRSEWPHHLFLSLGVQRVALEVSHAVIAKQEKI